MGMKPLLTPSTTLQLLNYPVVGLFKVLMYHIRPPPRMCLLDLPNSLMFRIPCKLRTHLRLSHKDLEGLTKVPTITMKAESVGERLEVRLRDTVKKAAD